MFAAVKRCPSDLNTSSAWPEKMAGKRSPHSPHSLYVATGTVAVVWLAFTAMALRAALNGRFEAHKGWMIRSYVVTWTFVGCRMAGFVPVFPRLGEEGVTAMIWLNWVVPVLICELVLQWRSTGPKKDQAH